MTTTPTEGEGLLGRWSRLKRSAVEEARPEKAGPEEAAPSAAAVAAAEPPAPPAPPPDLPPIESLGLGSDYAAFLAEGVPEELRRLALRRAWTSDPRIADFRGFADYDWDYNAPGYGRLLPIDDIKRLCDAVLGRVEPDADAAAATAPAPEEAAPGPEPLPEPDGAAVASVERPAPPAARDNGDALEGCKTTPPALA